jgi:hypothetical protein
MILTLACFEKWLHGDAISSSASPVALALMGNDLR